MANIDIDPWACPVSQWERKTERKDNINQRMHPDIDEARATAIADSYMMGFSSGRMHALTVSRFRFEKTAMEQFKGLVNKTDASFLRRLGDDAREADEAIARQKKRFLFLRTTLEGQNEGDREAWKAVETGIRQGGRFAARVFFGKARQRPCARRWRCGGDDVGFW